MSGTWERKYGRKKGSVKAGRMWKKRSFRLMTALPACPSRRSRGGIK